MEEISANIRLRIFVDHSVHRKLTPVAVSFPILASIVADALATLQCAGGAAAENEEEAPVQGLEADEAAAGQPGREFPDDHGRVRFPGRLQRRGDDQHAPQDIEANSACTPMRCKIRVG